MFVVAYLLWRHAISSSERVQKLQNALVESTLARARAAERAAEAANASAEAATKAAEAARLVAVALEKRHAS